MGQHSSRERPGAVPGSGVPFYEPRSPDGMGQHGFHGAHAAEPEQDLLPSWFPRTMTAEITNDPRVSAQTIIEKRFAAFETLVVSAILLAGSSCTGLLELQANAHSLWSREYLATWLYVLVFS